MFDVVFDGQSFKLVRDKRLLDASSLLFAGFAFFCGVRYKKYLNWERKVYLVEA